MLNSAEKCLGKVLGDISRAEAVAVSATRILDSSGLLSEIEHRFIEEKMHREEVKHRDMMLAWATKFGGPGHEDGFRAMVTRDGLIMGALSDPKDKLVYTLATVLWNEENTLRAYPRWIKIFDRLNKDLASDFRQVLNEEKGHVSFGRGIVKRLNDEKPELARRFSVFYEVTRRAYPVLIHRAMISTQKVLQEYAGS